MSDDAKFQEVMQRHAGRELADLDRLEVNLAAEAFNKSMELIVPTPEVSEFGSLATATIGSGGASGLETSKINGQQDDQILFFGLPINDPSPSEVVTEGLPEALQSLEKRERDIRNSNRDQIDIRTGDIATSALVLKKKILNEIYTGMQVYKLITQSHLDRHVVIDRAAHANMIQLADCLAFYVSMLRSGRRFLCQCGRPELHKNQDEKPSETMDVWLKPKMETVRAAAMAAERDFKSLYETNLKK